MIPAPGRYVSEKAWRHLPAIYVQVHGPAACRGPHIDVTFNVTGAKPARRTVRIAVDGSWRCASTLLPFNCYGDTFT